MGRPPGATVWQNVGGTTAGWPGQKRREMDRGWRKQCQGSPAALYETLRLWLYSLPHTICVQPLGLSSSRTVLIPISKIASVKQSDRREVKRHADRKEPEERQEQASGRSTPSNAEVSERQVVETKAKQNQNSKTSQADTDRGWTGDRSRGKRGQRKEREAKRPRGVCVVSG